jgi:ribonuclease D
LSYQALVLALLGVEIDKSQARTEWMRRPLKTEQLRYAADDVRYLAQLYPIEVAELVRQRRMDWLKDEVERLYFPSCYQLDLSLCWEHVKGAGKLKRNELNVLKHLAAWREKLAIQRDLPRKWLVSDETLLSLAIEQPQNERQSISPQLQEHRTVRGHMKELVALITQAQQEPEALWPHGNHCRRPSEAEDEAVDSLMSIIRTRADELRISPSRITSKSDLLKLVRGERTLLLLSGWRLKIAGQAVLDALDTHRERSY